MAWKVRRPDRTRPAWAASVSPPQAYAQSRTRDLERPYGHAEQRSNLVSASPLCHQLLNLIDSFLGKFPTSLAEGLPFVIVMAPRTWPAKRNLTASRAVGFYVGNPTSARRKPAEAGLSWLPMQGLPARVERASPPNSTPTRTVGCTAQGRRSHKKAPPGAGQAASVRARVRSPRQFQTGSETTISASHAGTRASDDSFCGSFRSCWAGTCRATKREGIAHGFSSNVVKAAALWMRDIENDCTSGLPRRRK